MRIRLLSAVVVAVVVLVHPTSTWSQTSGGLSRNSLIDALVWGADVAVDWNDYLPEVRAEAQRFVQRF